MRAVALRAAEAADADAVAMLHAASWRSAYRGILADAYLDGDIARERRAVWRDRLSDPAIRAATILACDGGDVLGFSCFMLDLDPVWGTLIDNLHVDPARRGSGIGRRLLGKTARLAGLAAAHRPVHLFCLAGNLPARGFYGRIAGEIVECRDHDEPDGRRHPVLRYAWASPAALAAGCR